LIRALLRSARHNYFVLKGHSLATAEMTTEFHRLQMLLRCPAEVAWHDRQLPQPATHPHHEPLDAALDTPAATSTGLAECVPREHIDFEQLLQFPDLDCRPSCEADTFASQFNLFSAEITIMPHCSVRVPHNGVLPCR